MIEEQKHQGRNDEVKTSDFYPQQEFNVAHDTSTEIDGLLGTFAKQA
jgi:hypothetical protein